MSEPFLLKPRDLKVDSFVEHEQHWVGITHIPTGIVCSCAQYEGKVENYRKALGMLTNTVEKYYKESKDVDT